MTHSLLFDAVSEDAPGRKWAARWRRSWPDYEAWFRRNGGDSGPDRRACEAALRRHMPEIVPLWRRLTMIAGGGDRAARFLSTWCPPPYLGGCSILAVADGAAVRLVRNYDLAPDLNEGLLLRSRWSDRTVMGMVEFLWGLSDGVNDAGLAAALAYGGRSETAEGFGVATILRYLLETCDSVEAAIAVLRRVPSHMAYNIALADRLGATATVELSPGGGIRVLRPAIATNHQHGPEEAERADFTRTGERRRRLESLLREGMAPDRLAAVFLAPPLFQQAYDRGFGTLFTADYDPLGGKLTLHWPGRAWPQSLEAFVEGRRLIRYEAVAEPERAAAAEPAVAAAMAALRPFLAPAARRKLDCWVAAAAGGTPDWRSLATVFVPGPCTAAD